MQGAVEPRDGLLVGEGDERARVGLRRVGGAGVFLLLKRWRFLFFGF
jgi:hypothetical protein